jgi:radical SAM protein (TIGR01212 family)
MNYPWNHIQPYNSYAPYFKKIFGERVQKISVDAGFTCPNRDGSKGTGGCTYCNNDAFNPSYCKPEKPILQQIEEGIEFHKVRYRRANKYLVYFQPYSNTYAPIEHLKKIYEKALSHPEVIGLVIGTRPDCVDDEILNYLKELSSDNYIMIEYGVESIYDETLLHINRGHNFAVAKNAIEKASSLGLNCGAHFIFGLPGESQQMMLDSVKVISDLPLKTIKFHQLQIVEGTRMAKDFKENVSHYNLFSFDEYVDFIIRFVEQLNPNFVIERFAGEVPPRILSGPGWGKIRNDQINVRIEKEMNLRNTWQGKYFQAKSFS